LEKFDDTILYQFICVPCAYCGRLMYPEKCEWICYDNNIQYPICQLTTDSSNPSMLLTFHPKHGTNKIAVCSSCKNPNNRSHFRPLHPIPNEIKAIPIQKRRFLSPIFMHCTLGRNSGDNIYTEYRILSGTMKFSKNFRSLTLYSGMEGAFLIDCDSERDNNSWIDRNLMKAANWLKQHNPYIRPYSSLISSNLNRSDPFPTAMHSIEDENVPRLQTGDIVVSPLDFPTEVHDEDSHYSRLMAGFVKTPENSLLPLSLDDPNLEPLLFPDLFP